tara:strand:- start:647 stop:1504 length:858 start_codon:yes stop_codon:yes gene_type:complete
MKILVTGGAGFIGTNLIKKLLSLLPDSEITSLDCYFTGKKSNHIKRVDYIEGYTWDIKKIFTNNNFDIIFHFGEYSRIVNSFKDINFISKSILTGTPQVLDFAVKCNAKLIYSASSSKFGNKGTDENLSPYSWMKSKMVELIKNYSNWFNLNYEISYFYNVYGPKQIYNGDYATVVAIFEKQFKNGEICTVVKPGTQKRDFTHVYDIVDALIKIMDINMNNEWHIRSGNNISLIELAELFGKWEFIPERKGERFTSVDIKNNTNELLKWKPKYTINDWIEKIKKS